MVTGHLLNIRYGAEIHLRKGGHHDRSQDVGECLQEHLRFNAAGISFLANFIIALVKVRTVNLTEIAAAFCSYA